MRIGELAADLSVSTKTLRHYEKIGLLPPAARGENGYRSFSPEAEAAARLVVALRRIDLSLDEIAGLLAGDRADLRRNLLGILDEKRSAVSLEVVVLQGKLEDMDSRYLSLATTPRDRPGNCICALLGRACDCKITEN
ncbi:MerR family transcriptional regulator [Pseudaestuariivita atlantica]|uniref:MerR family transcriptional regulator n=1 Tax=Pseudaestuariivita atlantica TaxID=1317121 RepID=UPI00067C86F4|nr:MerR family transcriptional regulator [Pseudaestuariivita atlantica]